MKKRAMLWIIIGIVVVSTAAWGVIVSKVEQAKYDVVEKFEAIEIRDYAPQIIAKVTVSGKQKEAINKGFRLIADYIFGNNTAAAKVAMTAPVIQQGSGDEWSIWFIMPASYTLETLPKPNNTVVTLHGIARKRYAVIRFSGIADEETLKAKTEILNFFIVERKLKAVSPFTFAFYNPPWTLPFFRRNEVMVEIVNKTNHS
jgi:hypothetical protein